MNNQEQDIHQLARGASISVAGKFAGRALNFLLQVILARFLSTGSFGLYSIGWAVLRLIGLIAPFGVDQGIIHFGSQYYRNDAPRFRYILQLASGISLAAGLALGLLLFQSAAWVSTAVFRKPDLEIILKIFAFSIPFIAGLRVLSSASTISKSTRYSIVAEEVGQPVLNAVFLLVAIGIGGSLAGILWAAVLSFGFAFLLAVFFILRLFPGAVATFESDRELPLRLLQFSIPAGFATLFGSLISWVDRMMVGIFLDESSTGIYAAVSLISVLFVTILSGIKMIFGPLIADLIHQGEMKRVEEIYRVSTKWALYISIPPALFFLFGSREFLQVVFGPEYGVGSQALIILVIAQLFNIATGALDILHMMMNRNRQWLSLTTFGFFACILLNILFIPIMGISGAALGTGTAVAAMYLTGMLMLRKQVGLWPYDKRFLKGVLAAGFTTIMLMLVHLLNLPIPVVKIAALLVTAFLSFALGLRFLRFDAEDQEVFQRIWTRIHPRSQQG